jgi:carbon-monoxide dehydrogenase large subunit
MTDTVETPGQTVLGQSVKRREDPRLVSGRGNFLDDVKLPGMLHAAVLRSQYAHATIKQVHVEAARQVPGVVGVFTAADFADLNPLPCAMPAAGVENNIHTPTVLAADRVHHLGEGIAVVVAENPYIARDALKLIEVDYEPLPVVVDAERALAADAPRLYDGPMETRPPSTRPCSKPKSWFGIASATSV